MQSPHSQPFQIHIPPNCSACSFQHILDFAYRGTLTAQDPQTLVDVIYLSDMWAIPGLNLLAATSLAELINKMTALCTELVLTALDCVELGIIVDPEVSRRVYKEYIYIRTTLEVAARIFQNLLPPMALSPGCRTLSCLDVIDWSSCLLERTSM